MTAEFDDGLRPLNFSEPRAEPRERPQPLGPQRPLFGGERGLLTATLVVWAVLSAWKIWLACNINVVWEEGHFLVAGMHPALAYPDIPAGWALFARLCVTLFGWTPLALRIPAVVVAQAEPLAIWFLALPLVGRRNALWAALLSMLLPPLGCSGPLYYPEATLQILLALMLGAMVRAQRARGLGWWIVTGVAAGLGLFTHYRFAAAGIGICLFALFTPSGRALLAKPGFWIAGLIAAAGLAPSVIYNLQNGAPAVAYHLVGRHAWRPNLVGPLIFLAQQIALCTPVFFIGLAGAAMRARRCARDGDARAGALLWTGATIFLAFALYTPFDPRSFPQWPFSAYVAFVPYLPEVFASFVDAARSWVGRRWRAEAVALAPSLGALFYAGASVFLLAWAHPTRVPVALRPRLVAAYEDWRQFEPAIASAQAIARARFGGEPLLATSGHVQAIRLEFPGQPGRQVYALGDPGDQLTHFDVFRAAIGLDRRALMTHRGAPVVLALQEPTFLYHVPAEAAFRTGLCGDFSDVAQVATVEAPPGRLALDLFVARVDPHPFQPGQVCAFLPEAYLARPKRAEMVKIGGDQNFYGMAASPKGVAQVEVLLDGRGVTQARIGLDPPGARAPASLTFDPGYPNVQFDFQLPAGTLTPGAHRIGLAVTAKDGSTVEGADRTIYAVR